MDYRHGAMCIVKCLSDEYGDILDVSDSLGLIGVGSVMFSGLSSVYNTVVSALAANQIKRAEMAGALEGGNIVAKVLAADKGAKVAASTKMLNGALTKTGHIGAVVTVGATGFSIGARAYAAVVATATVLGLR